MDSNFQTDTEFGEIIKDLEQTLFNKSKSKISSVPFSKELLDLALTDDDILSEKDIRDNAERNSHFVQKTSLEDLKEQLLDLQKLRLQKQKIHDQDLDFDNLLMEDPVIDGVAKAAEAYEPEEIDNQSSKIQNSDQLNINDFDELASLMTLESSLIANNLMDDMKASLDQLKSLNTTTVPSDGVVDSLIANNLMDDMKASIGQFKTLNTINEFEQTDVVSDGQMKAPIEKPIVEGRDEPLKDLDDAMESSQPDLPSDIDSDLSDKVSLSINELKNRLNVLMGYDEFATDESFEEYESFHDKLATLGEKLENLEEMKESLDIGLMNENKQSRTDINKLIRVDFITAATGDLFIQNEWGESIPVTDDMLTPDDPSSPFDISTEFKLMSNDNQVMITQAGILVCLTSSGIQVPLTSKMIEEYKIDMTKFAETLSQTKQLETSSDEVTDAKFVFPVGNTGRKISNTHQKVNQSIEDIKNQLYNLKKAEHLIQNDTEQKHYNSIVFKLTEQLEELDFLKIQLDTYSMALSDDTMEMETSKSDDLSNDLNNTCEKEFESVVDKKLNAFSDSVKDSTFTSESEMDDASVETSLKERIVKFIVDDSEEDSPMQEESGLRKRAKKDENKTVTFEDPLGEVMTDAKPTPLDDVVDLKVKLAKGVLFALFLVYVGVCFAFIYSLFVV